MTRKTTSLALLLAAASLVPSLSLAAQVVSTNALSAVPPPGSSGDPVVAKGKGVEIKRSELAKAIARAEAQVAARGRIVKPDERIEMERQLLEQLINNQLVLAKA